VPDRGRDGPLRVLLNTDTDRPSRTGTALQYALDLHDAGHDVAVFLDGTSTQWPGAVARQFQSVLQADLLAGACAKRAASFGTAEAIQASGVRLLGQGADHRPDAGRLVEDGSDLLTV